MDKNPETTLLVRWANGAQLTAVEKTEVEKLTKSLRREVVEKTQIFVGAGTCGLGAGAGATIDAVNAYLAEKNLDVEVVPVGCIGLCCEEPLMEVHMPGRSRIMYKQVTGDKVKKILDDIFAGQITKDAALLQHRPAVGVQAWDGLEFIDENEFFAPQTRWVLKNCGLINPRSLEEYIASGGYVALAKTLKNFNPAQTCDEVEKSGLRGRGGGGFPTGSKWKFALNVEADKKYIVCNADEGDPGAFMDRAVIEGDPHRLLEGMAIAGYAIGAEYAYIYIRAEYPLAIERLEEAIAAAELYGLLGDNIMGTNHSLHIKIKKGAGAFVCGEETALLHSIEGRRGMPRPRPPFPAVKGVFGKPTVINNVETLANLPELMSHGADWFSAIGTATSKGTKVFALSGKVARTGLVEVAMGTTVRDVIMKIGGGIAHGRAYKATQIGGPSGGCIPEQHLGIEIDYESLKTVGAMMGSGGLVVMDEDNCMVDVAKFFMDFIQRESCGKCTPCREGTRRMLETLTRLTRGRKSEKDEDSLRRFQSMLQLQELAETIRDTSLCGLGQTAPNPVLSTLQWFPEEYEAHLYDRHCPAGVCSDLLTFAIDTEKCVGCTLCAKRCPSDAIVGSIKNPHYIVHDKCIGCGSCLDACRFGAVSKS